ncbi:unnamed protein product, partial [Ectocarpus sp. 12 AP-2014]
ILCSYHPCRNGPGRLPRREEKASERTYPPELMVYQAVRKYLVWVWGAGLDGHLIFLLVVEYDMLSAAEGFVRFLCGTTFLS